MKTAYREDVRGYIHNPQLLITMKVGQETVTSTIGDLKGTLKKHNLSWAFIHGAWLDTEQTQKVGVFPVLRPLTQAAAVGMRAAFQLGVDPGVGYSLRTQGECADIGRALVELGVAQDELEIEWMVGPKVQPAPQSIAPKPQPAKTNELVGEVFPM